VRAAPLEPGALRDASDPTQETIVTKEKLQLRQAGTPFPRVLCTWLRVLTAEVSVHVESGHYVHMQVDVMQLVVYIDAYLVFYFSISASGPSLNLGMNLIFIVGCLLVCGVVIYRSGRTKAGYQRLPTSDAE